VKIPNVWHTDGETPYEFPAGDGASSRYLVLRKYRDGRLDIAIEPWVPDTDLYGTGIVPAHFSAWSSGMVVGWQALPPPITENPSGWYSEYRGDENPRQNGSYLCTATRDYKQYYVESRFWNEKKGWTQLREGEEVLAWRKNLSIPKIARRRGCGSDDSY
jgi:hypothetical protein